MDVTLPRILSTGMGSNPAAQALDAARSALSSSAARGAEIKLQDQGFGTGLSATESAAGAPGVMQSFSSLLTQAVQDINQTQQVADDGAAKLAAGEPVDLHNVMIGMESANLSLGLALQVRNKLLDAYQEVMRMVI